MQWTRYLFIVLVGIILPAASLCLANLGLRHPYKVYHTERETKTFAKLGLVFEVTTISTVVLLLTTERLRLSIDKLAGLLIKSMIVYIDVLAGRSPIIFRFAALLLGFAFGLSNDRWVGCPIWRWGASIIGLIKKAAMRFQKHPNIAAFGMGDAYDAWAMGALVGLPFAVFGWLIALILVVLYALPISMFEKRSDKNIMDRLGPSFLLATIMLFFFF